ncbi:MAG: aspartate--tRNA ligase [Deltaproteobacteria bacterium RIFCSPLOWO2_02_44_9]|nr:MAG: aspartate--tRNA ligase [Deltaproteobacteria bacterium RIFCSPLOWO2_02_44_9]
MAEHLGDWKRSHYCGELADRDTGNNVTLMGWVQRRRDHGGLIFVDLRDREGLVQIVFNPAVSAASHETAHHIRSEFVLAVKGAVSKRPAGTENPELKTGGIEILVKELKILNESATPPFLIEDKTDVAESVRLKYRYLDLRRPALQKNLILRHEVCRLVRDYLSERHFLEVETPALTKSTPEGARDYLVPSRLNPGHFFALPQSPQLFKQILMVAGFDRYFQIVRCFRDEDLRADRQPEFTQIDAEMSFVDREDVMGLMEGLIAELFERGIGVKLSLPFPRLTYAEAVGRYGLDNPDTRFGLELKDITSIVKDSGFKVFADAVKKGGIIKALNAKGCGEFSRKELDELTLLANSFGAKGLAWVKITAEGWQSPIAKFLTDDEKTGIIKTLDAKAGDLLLFVADNPRIANTALGRVRLNIGERLNLIQKGIFNLVWVTDFPLLEYDEEAKRFVAVHHPFTAPLDEDIPKMDTAPLEVRAKAYDLVLNGTEIGGGSIRIHRRDVQSLIFTKLGINDEDARQKFGFLLDALDFGAPPHCGIAFGLDRLVAILCGAESIRDVIAFPKTQKATCFMTDAPSPVEKKQLDELSLRVKLSGQQGGA